MALHHEAHEGHGGGSHRKDHKAAHHSHPHFGKAGGGHGGLMNRMISSPQSPKMPGTHKALAHAKMK
jgi:hypothetical protein